MWKNLIRLHEFKVVLLLMKVEAVHSNGDPLIYSIYCIVWWNLSRKIWAEWVAQKDN